MASDSACFCADVLPRQGFTITCGTASVLAERSKVLLVGDLLHPRHRRTVDRLLDGDVSHGLTRRRAMPMPVCRRAPQDVARVELKLRSAFHLRPADALRYDQSLARWMRVPCSARTRFEVDNRASHPRWVGSLELACDSHPTGEVFRRSLDPFQLRF